MSECWVFGLGNFVHFFVLVVEDLLDLEDEVAAVNAENVLNLLHQVYNVGEGEPLALNYLLVILGCEVLEFGVGFVFSVVEGELDVVFLFGFDDKISEGIGELFFADFLPLLLLGQHYNHDFGDFVFLCHETFDLVSVEALHI